MSFGSICPSPAITTEIKLESKEFSKNWWPVSIAAPTPSPSSLTNSTSEAKSPVPSVEPSSTTTTLSTKSGIVARTFGRCSDSLRAGMTTPTRTPSNMALRQMAG